MSDIEKQADAEMIASLTTSIENLDKEIADLDIKMNRANNLINISKERLVDLACDLELMSMGLALWKDETGGDLPTSVARESQEMQKILTDYEKHMHRIKQRNLLAEKVYDAADKRQEEAKIERVRLAQQREALLSKNPLYKKPEDLGDKAASVLVDGLIKILESTRSIFEKKQTKREMSGNIRDGLAFFAWFLFCFIEMSWQTFAKDIVTSLFLFDICIAAFVLVLTIALRKWPKKK
jgi:hypothetical protein